MQSVCYCITTNSQAAAVIKVDIEISTYLLRTPTVTRCLLPRWKASRWLLHVTPDERRNVFALLTTYRNHTRLRQSDGINGKYFYLTNTVEEISAD
ncbi:unnamed protein product, partial [Dicrocoelium dendriticum]